MFIFIFNVINGYVYEKALNVTDLLAISRALSVSSFVLFVSIIPLLLLGTSVLIINISYFNNEYCDETISNFFKILSSNESVVASIIFLIFLAIVIPKQVGFIGMLIVFLVFIIFMNYIKQNKK